MLARVLDPVVQLLPRRDRTGRVIWKTEINKIDMFLWGLGNKIVFRRTRQIDNAFITAVLFHRAGVARHHVGIDVDRVNRIGNGNLVLLAEDIEDVTAIAFRSVGQKDFVVHDVDLAVTIIVLRDCRS